MHDNLWQAVAHTLWMKQKQQHLYCFLQYNSNSIQPFQIMYERQETWNIHHVLQSIVLRCARRRSLKHSPILYFSCCTQIYTRRRQLKHSPILNSFAMLRYRRWRNFKFLTYSPAWLTALRYTNRKKLQSFTHFLLFCFIKVH